MEAQRIILDQIRDNLAEYCILPSPEAYDAVVLWCAATHIQAESDYATRLCLTAPEMRCGKSRTLKLVECFSHHPIPTVNSSAAVLVEDIDSHPDGVTILADEYDQWLSGSGPLVGIFNGGFERGKPYRRKENGVSVARNTFAFAALAGIGGLPPTMADRSIVIQLRRRAPDETVKPFRLRRDELPMRSRGTELGEWIEDHAGAIHEMAEPAMPVEDRAADLWSLLMRIAAVATAEQGLHESNPRSWLYRARQAAMMLTADAEEAREASTGQKLLSILRGIFEKRARVHTADLVELVAKADPETFGDMSGILLASMLGPYGVKPKQMRIGDTNAKGYEREAFKDAFMRYLPREDSKSGTVTAFERAS